jgi:hypothetical protein
VAVTLPPRLVALNVKLVVEVGLTDVEAVPTTPTPLSIAICVAPLTLQASVDDWPGTMLTGDAEKELMTGAGVLELQPAASASPAQRRSFTGMRDVTGGLRTSRAALRNR